MTKKKIQSRSDRIESNFAKNIVQFMQGKRYSPMTAEELCAQLSIPEPLHTTFCTALDSLVKSKELALQNGRFRLNKPQADLVTGTISVHAIKGFGFVKNDRDGGKDIFIPKQSIRDAVDGDTVEVEITEISAKGPEGRVIAILQRSRTHLACIVTEKEGDRYIAYAPLLGSKKTVYVRTQPKETLKNGDRITCKVLDWNCEDGSVDAVLTRLIGHITDPSCDVTAAIEEFELPHEFTREAILEAKSFPKKVAFFTIPTQDASERGKARSKRSDPNDESIAEGAMDEEEDRSGKAAAARISVGIVKEATKVDASGRLDLTELECVTIDPDTAKDFDDAISLTCNENGHYHLGIHIADVAAYVKKGSHLDKNAFLHCNSTYFPGICVPMLPGELSNELCSLKPKVNRLTMSVLAEFDPAGNIVDYKIARTCIKSRKRFTYKEALAVLEGQKKSVFRPLLDRMVDLCHLLKHKRSERGSIDFAMAEGVVIVDEQGVPQRIERHEYDITHQMIEEFMLKANEIVATHLFKMGKELIYRIHDEPSAETFEDFYNYARALGFTLTAQPTVADLQNLFLKAKDSALAPQLSVSFIRSMKLAFYSPDNIGHYGLALEHYCHFTSPIRRYTDLIIQRLLVNEEDPNDNLTKIAEVCSEKERQSCRAESSVVQLKKLRLAARYYDEDPNKCYFAVVTRVKPFALFFEIPEFDLETSIHISELGNDYFEFNSKQLSFRGSRSGKTYTCGATLSVRIEEIDLIRQQARWVIAGQSPKRPRRR
ncbi:MAG: Ribonuclease [Parachlamydiales bacterium]|nr:Ribonuclease [Parachlamydiales bacterium]